MAVASKCPRCDATGFEIAVESPTGSKAKICFVRCATCGAVVGAVDYGGIGAMLDDLAEDVRRIAAKAGVALRRR